MSPSSICIHHDPFRPLWSRIPAIRHVSWSSTSPRLPVRYDRIVMAEDIYVVDVEKTERPNARSGLRDVTLEVEMFVEHSAFGSIVVSRPSCHPSIHAVRQHFHAAGVSGRRTNRLFPDDLHSDPRTSTRRTENKRSPSRVQRR